MSQRPANVTILSDGTGPGTELIVDGHRIPGVRVIEWRAERTGVRVTVHIDRAAMEMRAEGFEGLALVANPSADDVRLAKGAQRDANGCEGCGIDLGFPDALYCGKCTGASPKL